MAGGRKVGRKQAGAARDAGLIDGVADWLMEQALAEADFETQKLGSSLYFIYKVK